MAEMKYDVVIQGGQSNAEGIGYGAVTRELTRSPNVWYLEAEKTVEVVDNCLRITYAEKPFSIVPAQERLSNDGMVVGDFSLTFAEAYEQARWLEEDRNLLIIRAGVGGAGFKKKLWGVGNVLHNKLVEMVDYALSLNVENRVVGFLWHQGEHDAFEKNDPKTFKAQLTETVADVRARYGKALPFIAGDFVNEWKSKNIEACRPIIEKIREVIQEMGDAAFVETSDLPSNNEKNANGDDIHFCRESLHILGRRYFNAYQELIGNK